MRGPQVLGEKPKRDTVERKEMSRGETLRDVSSLGGGKRFGKGGGFLEKERMAEPRQQRRLWGQKAEIGAAKI